MRYVHAMGGIWKISDRNFRKLERDLVKGEIDLDSYGPMIIGEIIQLEDLEDEAEDKKEAQS